MRHTPYAILYGAEGADYPYIREDGPYWNACFKEETP